MSHLSLVFNSVILAQLLFCNKPKNKRYSVLIVKTDNRKLHLELNVIKKSFLKTIISINVANDKYKLDKGRKKWSIFH